MSGAPAPDAEPTREQLAAALATNAASKPINLGVPVVVVVVALVAGLPVALAFVVAALAYTAATARTMFDRAEAQRVEERWIARQAARGERS
jgi:hypothetical protein